MNRRKKGQSNRNRNGRANTSAANPEGSASRRKLLLPTAIVVLIVVGFVAFYKQPAPQRGTLTSAHEKESGLATNGGAGSSGTRIGSDIVSTNAFNHPQEEETMSDPEIAVHLLNQGNELLNQERTEEAVETFRRARSGFCLTALFSCGSSISTGILGYSNSVSNPFHKGVP